MAWWEIDTIIQDRKKRKIRVAQQKGSMVNLSPSINYSCSQMTPFPLCSFSQDLFFFVCFFVTDVTHS